MIIDILDIGSGNIKSIQNWIERVNVPTRIISKATDIESNFLILPGVGSAGPYMDKMRKGNFDIAIKEHIQKGNRLLGICLGFQIMGQFSEEDGGIQGLNLLEGQVKKLSSLNSHNEWESFRFNKKELKEHSFNSSAKLTKKQKIDGRVFYNHEYGFISSHTNQFNIPISKNLNQYSALVIKDNIIGIQFHPEKSQQTGLELISMML